MTSTVVTMPDPQTPGASATSSRLPSILGMYALAAATFVVGAHMAHWYGSAQSATLLFPLVLFFGLAEFCAGGWALWANDAIALAMHATWGVFWTAFGILQLMISGGRLTPAQGMSSELGFWFVAIAAITWGITAASRNKEVSSVLGLLAIGSTLEAIAALAGADGLRILAGYFLLAAAVVAWYVASALLMRFTRRVKSHAVAPVTAGESARVA